MEEQISNASDDEMKPASHIFGGNTNWQSF